MRFALMLLTVVVGFVLAGCEQRTDFEKKAEADGNARRAINLKREADK